MFAYGCVDVWVRVCRVHCTGVAGSVKHSHPAQVAGIVKHYHPTKTRDSRILALPTPLLVPYHVQLVHICIYVYVQCIGNISTSTLPCQFFHWDLHGVSVIIGVDMAKYVIMCGYICIYMYVCVCVGVCTHIATRIYTHHTCIQVHILKLSGLNFVRLGYTATTTCLVLCLAYACIRDTCAYTSHEAALYM